VEKNDHFAVFGDQINWMKYERFQLEMYLTEFQWSSLEIAN